MSYANNKGADQPAHPRSLISAFVVHCLDSVMSLVSVTKISSLMLASVAEQDSSSLTSSETPEDTFSHGEVHFYNGLCFFRLHFGFFAKTKNAQHGIFKKALKSFYSFVLLQSALIWPQLEGLNNLYFRNDIQLKQKIVH